MPDVDMGLGTCLYRIDELNNCILRHVTRAMRLSVSFHFPDYIDNIGTREELPTHPSQSILSLGRFEERQEPLKCGGVWRGREAAFSLN